GDLEEPQAPGQEGVHGDLVGRVEHAWSRATRARRLARQAQARERVEVDRLEVQLADLSQVERGDRQIDALPAVQGVGDGYAHVRRAEVGQHRAVRQLDQPVDERLRVHDHV